jgi:hypothetical protein
VSTTLSARLVWIGAALLALPASAQELSFAGAINHAFLMGCNLHVIGARKVDDQAGFNDPNVAFTAEGAPTEVLRPGPPGTGRKVVAKVNSSEAPIWITAYPDSGFCMIMAFDGDLASGFQTLVSAIEAEGSFWKRRPGSSSDDRKGIEMRAYSASLTNGSTAGLLVSYRPATVNTPGRLGLVSFPDR